MMRNLRVSVLPVPNLVFFPNSTLPLFIVEPVYVSMIHDCVAASELLAVSMAQPIQVTVGRIRYTPKAICSVGRPYIEKELSDGSLKVLLKGIARINLEQIIQNIPYLRFEASFVPDRESGTGFSENSIERLHDVLNNWIDDNILDSLLRENFRQSITTVAQVIDAISMFMVNDVDIRQILLENTSLFERVGLLNRLFQNDIADFQVIRALKNYESLEKNIKASH